MSQLSPITGPQTNFNAPDEAVAQSIAQDSRWQVEDSTGAIYDHDGVYLAANLAELTQAMDQLDWFVRARASGVNWKKVPADLSIRADRLRGVVRSLRA